MRDTHLRETTGAAVGSLMFFGAPLSVAEFQGGVTTMSCSDTRGILGILEDEKKDFVRDRKDGRQNAGIDVGIFRCLLLIKFMLSGFG